MSKFQKSFNRIIRFLDVKLIGIQAMPMHDEGGTVKIQVAGDADCNRNALLERKLENR
jgi:hypothetical protein